MNIKHKMYGTKEYKSWGNMKKRCNNPNDSDYTSYGGRGISICNEWLNFINFYKDMGKCPKNFELDRIDVNKGYSKDNCRWVSESLQAYNQRRYTNNTSGKTGVTFKKSLNKWNSRISFLGKRIHLGYFDNLAEAIDIRNKAELQYYGKVKE